MIRLGITGGIGSGKSYVCRMMEEEFGVPVYNCDIRARIITLTDTDVIQQLSALDPLFYDADGEFDKEHMARYLFASEDNYRRVNSIIHPAVRRDLREWLSFRSSAEVVAVESAILYESHLETEVDRVLYVDAPLDIRIRRVKRRDGLSSEQIRQRLARQLTDEARQRADFTLQNDGIEPLAPQIRKIIDEIVTNYESRATK